MYMLAFPGEIWFVEASACALMYYNLRKGRLRLHTRVCWLILEEFDLQRPMQVHL